MKYADFVLVLVTVLGYVICYLLITDYDYCCSPHIYSAYLIYLINVCYLFKYLYIYLFIYCWNLHLSIYFTDFWIVCPILRHTDVIQGMYYYDRDEKRQRLQLDVEVDHDIIQTCKNDLEEEDDEVEESPICHLCGCTDISEDEFYDLNTMNQNPGNWL